PYLTRDATSLQVVSWCVPKEQGQYRNAAGNMETTCGSIELPEDFSSSRQLINVFQIAETLVYPIMCHIERNITWDGVTIPETKNLFCLLLLTPTIADTLSLGQQQQLSAALHSIKVVFLGTVGRLTWHPYVLPIMPDALLSAQAPYSVPHKLQAATLQEVERLPDKDFPWAAPAFVVPKKDGSVRFLSDFRRLDRWLWRSYFPLPKIQDLIRELPQPCFITTLDLVMTYYSRVLALQSRLYTTTVLPWEKYRYCHLPMGISTAPDEFHAVMTQFCAQSVDYLGCNISTEGKRSIACKVDKDPLLKWIGLARPRNARDLRRFIGMVNYYKNMRSSRSQTQHHALRYIVLSSISLEPSREQATRKKTSQDKPLLLAYPDFDKVFNIYKDASDYQLGGKGTAQYSFDATRIPLIVWGQKIRVSTDHLYFNAPEYYQLDNASVEIRRSSRRADRLPIDSCGALVVATSTVEDAELFSLVPTSIKDEQVKASLKPTEDVRMREISGVNLLTTVKDGRIVVSLPLQPAIMRTYHE
ncbi:hypothetical protein GN958_ATG13410, partial [Phytophthora infestans]